MNETKYLIKYPDEAENKKWSFFWKRVKKTKTCWVWNGYLNPKGYGIIHINKNDKTRLKKSAAVHRLLYEHIFGPISDGMQMDHLCRNRACVNPFHLEPVTPRENGDRAKNVAFVNREKTHCIRGHPFSKENTYLYLDPRTGRNVRLCKICKKEASLAEKQRRESKMPTEFRRTCRVCRKMRMCIKTGPNLVWSCFDCWISLRST